MSKVYLDKLGRVVRVDRLGLSYCAVVRLKTYKGSWWKAFQTEKIRPNRDPAVVQARLDKYAKIHGLPWINAVVDKTAPDFVEYKRSRLPVYVRVQGA